MYQNDPANAQLHMMMQRFVAASEDTPAQRLANQAFYRRLQPPIEQEALFATGLNRELAANVAQNAWTKIIRTANTYDPSKSSVIAWARMITKQCAMDEFRQHFKHHRANSAGAGALDQDVLDAELDERHFMNRVGPLPSGEEALHAKQVSAAAFACMAKLPSHKWPNIQLAFTLYLDSELTYNDVADQLRASAPAGVTFNGENVRSWVNQGRDRVRACLRRKLDLQGGDYA